MIEFTAFDVFTMIGKVVLIAGTSFIIMDGMKAYHKFDGFNKGGKQNARNESKSTSERLKQLSKMQSQE